MSKTEDKENKGTPVTKQLQKATSGFLGGDRMAEHYSEDVRIRVDHITGPVLGKELLKRCGDEGSEQRLNLTDGQFSSEAKIEVDHIIARSIGLKFKDMRKRRNAFMSR